MFNLPLSPLPGSGPICQRSALFHPSGAEGFSAWVPSKQKHLDHFWSQVTFDVHTPADTFLRIFEDQAVSNREWSLFSSKKAGLQRSGFADVQVNRWANNMIHMIHTIVYCMVRLTQPQKTHFAILFCGRTRMHRGEGPAYQGHQQAAVWFCDRIHPVEFVFILWICDVFVESWFVLVLWCILMYSTLTEIPRVDPCWSKASWGHICLQKRLGTWGRKSTFIQANMFKCGGFAWYLTYWYRSKVSFLLVFKYPSVCKTRQSIN